MIGESKRINIGEVRAILRSDVDDTSRARTAFYGRLRRILRRLDAELNPSRDRVADLERLRGHLLFAISRVANHRLDCQTEGDKL